MGSVPCAISESLNPAATTVCDGKGTCGLAEATPASILPAAAPPFPAATTDVTTTPAAANRLRNFIHRFMIPPCGRLARYDSEDIEPTHQTCVAHVIEC